MDGTHVKKASLLFWGPNSSIACSVEGQHGRFAPSRSMSFFTQLLHLVLAVFMQYMNLPHVPELHHAMNSHSEGILSGRCFIDGKTAEPDGHARHR